MVSFPVPLSRTYGAMLLFLLLVRFQLFILTVFRGEVDQVRKTSKKILIG